MAPGKTRILCNRKYLLISNSSQKNQMQRDSEIQEAKTWQLNFILNDHCCAISNWLPKMPDISALWYPPLESESPAAWHITTNPASKVPFSALWQINHAIEGKSTKTRTRCHRRSSPNFLTSVMTIFQNHRRHINNRRNENNLAKLIICSHSPFNLHLS